MGQSVDQGGDKERTTDDREALPEARRSIASTRARLEELADRLRELGLRLGEGPAATPPGAAGGSGSTTFDGSGS